LLINKGFTCVVRLNEESTYDAKAFKDAGLKHYDMYIDDNSVPKNSTLSQFFKLCQQPDEKVAVHCRAGLGRTGTLIAASLIKFYGFTAEESIAWVRIVRPGSVIGGQQQYLQFLEGVFRIQTPTPTTVYASRSFVTPAVSRAAVSALSHPSATSRNMPALSSLTDFRPVRSVTSLSSLRDTRLRSEALASLQHASGASNTASSTPSTRLAASSSREGSSNGAGTQGEDDRDENRAPHLMPKVMQAAATPRALTNDPHLFRGHPDDYLKQSTNRKDPSSCDSDNEIHFPHPDECLPEFSSPSAKDNDRHGRTQLILASQEKRIARRMLMQEKSNRA
jgi:hypothetical protein